VGELGQRGATYVKLLDRFDVITCAQCYEKESVQADRDRYFQPERDAETLKSGEA
jgi:hypothetical protein